MDKKVCISCNKEVSNIGATIFNCPNCGKYEIVRCKHCKEIVAKYICKSCNFTGPN